MKRFFELGNRYAEQSDWTDFALVKFCLCAIGVIIGTQVPNEKKKAVISGAGTVFLVTYLPLMAKILIIVRQMWKEGDENHE